MLLPTGSPSFSGDQCTQMWVLRAKDRLGNTGHSSWAKDSRWEKAKEGEGDALAVALSLGCRVFTTVGKPLTLPTLVAQTVQSTCSEGDPGSIPGS